MAQWNCEGALRRLISECDSIHLFDRDGVRVFHSQVDAEYSEGACRPVAVLLAARPFVSETCEIRNRQGEWVYRTDFKAAAAEGAVVSADITFH